MDHAMWQPYQPVYSVKYSIVHNVENYLLSYSTHNPVSFFLNATSNDMQKLRNERFNILLRLASMYWHKKQPVANIINGNVQLYVLSHIAYYFQGVTDIVFHCLPKPSQVNIISKQNLIKYFRRSRIPLI